ncbi:isoleucine--tRNA ligase, chloroplastic mitochondrial [Olea europaea subsp. europaea]|uniref:Isoleucine--tRNA ligase, chloroplastic mitochondrial n=1 Tax=Olea europaea subsp. europaea TaxID=158383 RepID=A0A8S0RTK1_OLEEU|nr:isoleucine--tRNA ligase, chloroplastic mitochondrial [Olea europaea subsp. europaea]
MIDRHALFQLENVVKNIKESYDSYQFFKIFQIIQRFVIVYLSNFYLDVAKDRLYVGVIAPVLPHLAEDVWQHLPFQFTTEDGCLANFVFESKWPMLNERHLAFPIEEVHFWEKILELRTEVNKVLEVARGKKLIGSSLEAKVYLHAFDDGLATRLVNMCTSENDADTLHRIFITSQVEILPSLENVQDEDILCNGEYLIQGKTKYGSGCHVQLTRNVKDAGVFHLKLALLTTIPRYVVAVMMLSASQYQLWQWFS